MDIKPNKIDYSVMLSKGIVGAVPFVGPLAAEVVGTLIPNQRLDRISKFLEILDKKVAELDQERVKVRFHDPEFINLLEDGFYQAARALTDERKDYIATIIKNSLSDEQLEYVQYKKLLSLLNDLNDAEIIILQGYSSSNDDEDFGEKHRDIILGPLPTVESSREEWDKAVIHKTFRIHLSEIGLLEPRFKKPKKGELPEFDMKTGRIKAQGYKITSLGGLLLRHLDLVSDR